VTYLVDDDRRCLSPRKKKCSSIRCSLHIVPKPDGSILVFRRHNFINSSCCIAPKMTKALFQKAQFESEGTISEMYYGVPIPGTTDSQM